MSLDTGHQLSQGVSKRPTRRRSLLAQKEGSFGPALTTLYLGISTARIRGRTAVVAFAIRDTVYLIDFCVEEVRLADTAKKSLDPITDRIVETVRSYERNNMAKFIGAGIPTVLADMGPSLCSRLWLELDVVPIVINPESKYKKKKGFWDGKRVDEQADSMARKCIVQFGPSMAPILQVGWHATVQVDAGFRARLNTIEDYENTCSGASWETVTFYANKLRAKKTKVAFFSSTPQGGGVSLMRHALVRFSRLLGVDVTWYVPKPRQSVFRITKNIHNILQGASDPDQRVPAEDKTAIMNWITDTADRYWFSEGGPLRLPKEGGADVVIIDDPQMIGLIPLIKRATPNRPVLFRSHIQIRSDLIAEPGSPQADVWDFAWNHIKEADMFISHPVPSFVPLNVPRDKVVYLPATSDWLDGLNKDINMWDTGYYRHIYNAQCHTQRMTELEWPARKYITQIARFDPAKGIPTVVDSYAEFRDRLDSAGVLNPPQLVICGNGSVDDPDASIIIDLTIAQIETQYPHLQKDISVMCLEPNDQVLNCLLSNAHVVLQLSTSEGFEIKVSEALHAGRPVIATRAGGIPLQVKDKVNGYLVDPGDSKAVADHLMDLFTDDELHEKMSLAAKTGVSDEVSTVGNAIGWYYLVSKWAGKTGSGLKGNGTWLSDMAREEAGRPYTEHENRLPRLLA